MTQRNWLVTGVNSGFGRHMTEQLLSRGDRVAGTVRKMDTMNDLKGKYGDLLWLAYLDVTDTPAIHQVVNKAFADLGKIDVVVNNAGYGLFGAAEELTDEQITHQINTNLLGPIQVVRAALPHLRAQGGARIIQLSTYGGQAAYPGGSLYHASKWGIEGFCESISQELAPFNIGVTIIEPGGARTEFRFGKLGPKMDAYDGTPAGMTRTILQDSSRLPNGDPVKMVKIMIDSVDQNPAPKRIVLGSDSYAAIQKALTERLAAVEAQKNVAFSTDFVRQRLTRSGDLMSINRKSEKPVVIMPGASPGIGKGAALRFANPAMRSVERPSEPRIAKTSRPPQSIFQSLNRARRPEGSTNDEH